MVGIADLLPAMSDETAVRLDRALAAVHAPAGGADQARLIAQRDALLALAGAAA